MASGQPHCASIATTLAAPLSATLDAPLLSCFLAFLLRQDVAFILERGPSLGRGSTSSPCSLRPRPGGRGPPQLEVVGDPLLYK